MADLQEMLKELLISSLEGAGKSVKGSSHDSHGSRSGGSHPGRGLAAGAGLGAAALTPVAFKGLEKLAREAGMHSVGELLKSPGKAMGNLGEGLSSKLEGKVTDQV